MAISTFEADEIVARANVNQRINQANAYFPVSVPNGGTGKTSLTSGNILLGNGTSGITSTATLPVSKGGTGRTSLTSGEVLVGNGTGAIATACPLPINMGGTGTETLNAGVVVYNGGLGLSSETVLPQSKGGTGVSNFYESGEWTPTVKKGAGDYLNRSGMYYRIGEMVFVSCYLMVSGTSSSGNYGVVITGLPYNANTYYPCAVGNTLGLINEPVTAYVLGAEITFLTTVKSGGYYLTPHLVNNQWSYINVSGWYKKT